LFEPAYLAEDIAFAESIANDTAPRVTGRDGLMAVRVVNAGNRSIMEKRIVKCETAV
jgi:myo-inositol 2-dehydrogenase/D-chiro-inositol 1-dehydrogenase/scyllo-inositol 2-dehydrogenase (NAD+)